MAEGKTNQEIMMENQLKMLLAKERAAKKAARKISEEGKRFSLDKDDLVKGIILREVLGPPKATEG